MVRIENKLADIVTDLTIFYKSPTFMHFICFATIILNIDKSVKLIGLFNTDSEISGDRLRVFLTLLFYYLMEYIMKCTVVYISSMKTFILTINSLKMLVSLLILIDFHLCIVF